MYTEGTPHTSPYTASAAKSAKLMHASAGIIEKEIELTNNYFF